MFSTQRLVSVLGAWLSPNPPEPLAPAGGEWRGRRFVMHPCPEGAPGLYNRPPSNQQPTPSIETQGAVKATAPRWGGAWVKPGDTHIGQAKAAPGVRAFKLGSMPLEPPDDRRGTEPDLVLAP